MIPFLWVPWLYWKWLALVVTGIILLGFVQSMILRKEYPFLKLFENNNEKQKKKEWKRRGKWQA